MFTPPPATLQVPHRDDSDEAGEMDSPDSMERAFDRGRTRTMTRIKGCSLAALALLIGASAAQAQSPCGTWNPVSMPAPAGRGLASVSASSATDMWAVKEGIYHWDGTEWTLIPAPGLGHQDSVFWAVAAVAPGDAWTVGTATRFGNTQTLVEHWNGSVLRWWSS